MNLRTELRLFIVKSRHHSIHHGLPVVFHVIFRRGEYKIAFESVPWCKVLYMSLNYLAIT